MDSTGASAGDLLLKSSFFEEKNALECARALLGKKLLTCINGALCAATITETEAYCAPEDKASHAWNNRRTQRTNTMFMAGGTAYIYLCYGIHHLFNVVCGPKDFPHAVLIRALQPLAGIETMLKRRKMEKPETRLTAGPGALSQAMGIKRNFNGLQLKPENAIWLEDSLSNIDGDNIVSTTRIGIDYAGEWAAKPWRFYLKNSEWISKK